MNIYIIIALMLIGAGVYATYGKRNKVFCFYEGEDGTNEFKWMKDNDGWVVFRGKKHKIMPERMSTMWLRTGIHILFPTRVMCHSYTWESAWPRDPRNKGRTILSPSVRNVIDKSDLVKSYFKTSSPTTPSKKQSILMQYLPLIAIGIVVIVAIYMYTNMQGLAAGLNALQQQLNTVLPK